MIRKEDIQKFTQLFSCDRIMILMHCRPDGDTLGTGFALKRLLELNGKRVTAVCNDEVPKKLDFFTEGKKNLDPDFEPETIVTVDTATPELLGKKYEAYANRVWLAVDHHATNSLYAENTILYPDKSSAGELLSDLIYESGITYDSVVASCLYGAISFDTGCFRFSNVKPETHLAAARLLSFDFDAAEMNRRMFDLAPLGQLKVENELLQNAELFCGGKAVIVTLTLDMVEQSGAAESDFEGLAAIARRIEGTYVSATLRENSDNSVRVSLRSECNIDVSVIASEFGGGGHVRASGCTINKPVDEVKELIMNSVERAFEKSEYQL